MHYYRIQNHIICLEEIRDIEPNFLNLHINFKNGGSTSIYFPNYDKRDEVIDELWHRLAALSCYK